MPEWIISFGYMLIGVKPGMVVYLVEINRLMLRDEKVNARQPADIEKPRRALCGVADRGGDISLKPRRDEVGGAVVLVLRFVIVEIASRVDLAALGNGYLAVGGYENGGLDLPTDNTFLKDHLVVPAERFGDRIVKLIPAGNAGDAHGGAGARGLYENGISQLALARSVSR